MGIKPRNVDAVVDRLSVAGAHAVGNELDMIHAPFTGFIVAVKADINVAGVTGTATVNLKKNGANMFANATPFTWATSSTTTVYDATDFAAGTKIAVTKGDKITLDITVAQTTVARGLVVSLQFSRIPGAIATGAVDPLDSR